MNFNKIREAKSHEELKKALTEVMNEIVMDWWTCLTKDTQKAISMLNNSRAVVSSIMLFGEGSARFVANYDSFICSFENKIADICNSGERYEYYLYNYTCSIYLRIQEERKKIKDKVLVLGLSEDLSAKVEKELLQKEKKYNNLRKEFNKEAGRIRKELLWNSFSRIIKGA